MTDAELIIEDIKFIKKNSLYSSKIRVLSLVEQLTTDLDGTSCYC